MNERIIEFINNIYPLSQNDLSEVLNSLEEIKVSKNYILIEQGSVCDCIWIIQKGLVRHYYVDINGKERNTWFSSDSTITSNVYSYINQTKSDETIETLEECLIYKLNFSDIKRLQKQNHEFCLWYIKMIEKYYFMQIEQRMDELQFLSASERYKALLELNPSYANRISLGNIASYLNISQETLSRIRSAK
jgi:CRP-like cAMP-binding protein